MPNTSAKNKQITEVLILLACSGELDCDSIKQAAREHACGCDISIEHVTSFSAILEQLHTKKHDIVMLDPAICGINLLDLIKQVRKDSEGSAILILGQLEEEQRFLAMKSGAADFLYEGQTPRDLLIRAISYTAPHRFKYDRLKTTIEEKLDLVPAAVHELRTPLACMKGAVEIVLCGMAGQINSDQDNLLKMTDTNINRLTGLINGIVDFYRIVGARMQPDIQPQDVADIVEETRLTIKPCVEKERLGLVIDLEENIPKILLDRNIIKQALLNLLHNAIRFTPNGGRINIIVRIQDENLVIRIGDSGIGIPKESLDKIFEPFYRIAHNSDQAPGAGLGLTIAKELIAMHGGTIDVQSKVDHGTTFTVTLPLNSPTVSEKPCSRSAKMPEKIP
jgi:signal transduction histidine kinase